MKKLVLILLSLPMIGFGQNINKGNISTKYSLKSYTPTPIFQGQTSLCASYALSNLRTIIYNLNIGITNQEAIDSNRFSPFFLYYMVMGSSHKNTRFTDGLTLNTSSSKTRGNKIGALDFMQQYGITQRKNVEGDSLFNDETKIWCYPYEEDDMLLDLNDAKNYKIDSFSRVIVGEISNVNSKSMRQNIVCNHWQELNVSRNLFQKILSFKRNKRGKILKKRCHKNNGKWNKINCKYHKIGRRKFLRNRSRDENFENRLYETKIKLSDINYIKYLLNNQNPLFIAFSLPSNFGKSKTIIEMNGEITCGPGHAMVVIGYDDSKKAFQLMNSWKDWGADGSGFSWVKYEDIKKLYNLSIYQLFAKDQVDKHKKIKQIDIIECKGDCEFIRKKCNICAKSTKMNPNFLTSDYIIPKYFYLNSSNSKKCIWYKNKR